MRLVCVVSVVLLLGQAFPVARGRFVDKRTLEVEVPYAPRANDPAQSEPETRRRFESYLCSVCPQFCESNGTGTPVVKSDFPGAETEAACGNGEGRQTCTQTYKVIAENLQAQCAAGRKSRPKKRVA